MKYWKTLALLLVLGAASGAGALSVESIEHASVRNDLTTLLSLRERADPDAAPYAAAYLEFRIGVAANVARDRKLAKSSLKSSAKILERELDNSPNSIEALALLANVYGMSIGVSPMKGPFLGRKAQKLIDRALELDPDNSHALLVKGISLFNTPSMFGGSHAAALAALDKAIATFADGTPEPAWGPVEARVWRALALDALERRSEAIEELNAALEREPDYAWARFILGNLQSAS